MSKATARHAKQGVDKKHIASKIAAKKAANTLRNAAGEENNRELLSSLGVIIPEGWSPSKALRVYRRAQYLRSRPDLRRVVEATVHHPAAERFPGVEYIEDYSYDVVAVIDLRVQP